MTSALFSFVPKCMSLQSFASPASIRLRPGVVYPSFFHIFVYFMTHKCVGIGQVFKGKLHIHTHTAMLVCLSPGQEDTGISRDELLIDEAVIEVFK